MIDPRDYDRATKLRLLARDLHNEIVDAQNAGLLVTWKYLESELGLGWRRWVSPGDPKFEMDCIQISRTEKL